MPGDLPLTDAGWTYWGNSELLLGSDLPPGVYGDVDVWAERLELGWHAEGWDRLHAAAVVRLAQWEDACCG